MALEAVKGVQNLQQLAKDFQVHLTQITMWKKQLTSQVAGLFKRGAECDGGTDEAFRQTYEKIGRLDVELEWLKKNWAHSTEQKRQLIDEQDLMVSIPQQGDLVGLPRSAYDYTPAGESQENVHLMRLLAAQYLRTPFFGSRRVTAWFQGHGYPINRKHVQRWMRVMDREGEASGPRTSRPHPAHPHYPYLLQDLQVVRQNFEIFTVACFFREGFCPRNLVQSSSSFEYWIRTASQLIRVRMQAYMRQKNKTKETITWIEEDKSEAISREASQLYRPGTTARTNKLGNPFPRHFHSSCN